MKCDHCGVKRFVCLMYNCTDISLTIRSTKYLLEQSKTDFDSEIQWKKLHTKSNLF